MGEQSKIEWTDATWNPVRGCVKVSPGCKFCYAEAFAERFRGVKGHPYEQGFDLRLVPQKLTDPLRWKSPRRVFVNSMSDLFQDGVPDEFIDQVFAVMAMSPRHTFQVLTKRAERMPAYLARPDRAEKTKAAARELGWALEFEGISMLPRVLPHVWLGVSVEDHLRAQERLPHLRILRQQGWTTFISYEPALGPVNWERWSDAAAWLIMGGESGRGARPCNPDWFRSAIMFCRRYGVAPFVKQLGAQWASEHGGHSKGGAMEEWPASLRVREYPRARHEGDTHESGASPKQRGTHEKRTSPH